jgi:hypothetical protein
LPNSQHTDIKNDLARIGKAVFHGVPLSSLCVISYWLITHLLSRAFSVSWADQLLGGMWAVVATIFVHRYSYEESVVAGARISIGSKHRWMKNSAESRLEIRVGKGWSDGSKVTTPLQ